MIIFLKKWFVISNVSISIVVNALGPPALATPLRQLDRDWIRWGCGYIHPSLRLLREANAYIRESGVGGGNDAYSGGPICPYLFPSFFSVFTTTFRSPFFYVFIDRATNTHLLAGGPRLQCLVWSLSNYNLVYLMSTIRLRRQFLPTKLRTQKSVIGYKGKWENDGGCYGNFFLTFEISRFINSENFLNFQWLFGARQVAWRENYSSRVRSLYIISNHIYCPRGYLFPPMEGSRFEYPRKDTVT